jgi:integrase
MSIVSSCKSIACGKQRTPAYRRHKPSGQAVVTLNGRDHYLGAWNTRASRDVYDRLIAEWLANGRQISQGDTITVAGVIKQYWPWAEKYYRKVNGTPTSECDQVRYALRHLNHLYGTMPAAEFGPLKYKAVRQLLIDGYIHPKYGQQEPLARRTINKYLGIVRRMFRWATENELVAGSVYHALCAVRGLQRGRSEARETEPVRPAPEHLVNATRPYVGRHVEALIDLQLLTGARPGELIIMRACDLATDRRIWVYTPESHKNEHRDQHREIYLGPKAQEIVKRFLKPELHAYLFNAAQAESERHDERRQNRKTPLYPSHVRHIEAKRAKYRARPPRDHYDVPAYRRAITRACERAFPLPFELAPQIKPNGKRESFSEWRLRLTHEQKEAIKQWRRDHHWYPHQLRHNAGTRLRREYGVELARIILGHATAFTTEIYAEADKQQAMEVIGKVG